MKKWLNKRLIVLVFAVMIMLSVGRTQILAAPNDSRSDLLYVTGYEVTNETITPGDDFTLKVEIKNFSSSAKASNVVVVIANPVGVTPEYGTVTQKYVGSVAAGATKEVSFRYTADTSIEESELNFTAYIVIDSTSSSSTELRIPVGRTVDFNVVDSTVPSSITVNETDYLSAVVENISNTAMSDVTMVARCDDVDIASANIGTMAAGISKTQLVNVSFDEVGQHTLELVLTYTNDEGAEKEFVISSGIIEVEDASASNSDYTSKDSTSTDSQQLSADESATGAKGIIVICLSGILLIAVSCVILILIYRRK
jgi:hypothetical protein